MQHIFVVRCLEPICTHCCRPPDSHQLLWAQSTYCNSWCRSQSRTMPVSGCEPGSGTGTHPVYVGWQTQTLCRRCSDRWGSRECTKCNHWFEIQGCDSILLIKVRGWTNRWSSRTYRKGPRKVNLEKLSQPHNEHAEDRRQESLFLKLMLKCWLIQRPLHFFSF